MNSENIQQKLRVKSKEIPSRPVAVPKLWGKQENYKHCFFDTNKEKVFYAYQRSSLVLKLLTNKYVALQVKCLCMACKQNAPVAFTSLNYHRQ